MHRSHYNPHRKLKAPTPSDKHEMEAPSVEFAAQLIVAVPYRFNRAIEITLRNWKSPSPGPKQEEGRRICSAAN
jgi:hypothetical protein